ncbi:energy-coupling factor transporter transmembrane protein EcfT [Clostridium pasteurianum DSM 525 = ATCC 6013]|uniref:Energy-coupling factor transporter transmembrane protein EcfT n=1 Tax=Clostridium pasteurianum DSM 525 = ATCC 6013 TaxID=1262449 RepID=A0A0H3JAN4_CLOPA|nr:energy-coupling factor transporter transmembrane component T [Clostridium pasteurianum]AJA49698.1 energy-coupling factor transporter transmembrane protein EcfT [Clostridium pasteurianum DSM 525 = ATCC 6013]AJA53686.1 energy-coupling factor transporter transmembrane protein EcfT [Clostridium pasteurianum DSM 525 = ATCC 6013]AOZ76847.1 transporter [Clostridium pasteurianum DSM 525 = ATCC 6013]AOZ80644.1 transporter [Clostridium pasteurianum]ELP57612.1 cobalt transport protein [Clostridium pas
MLKDITIGQYVPEDSFIHKLDPRIKIILCMVYIIDLFLINQYFGYIFVVLFIGITILASKMKFIYIYKGLKPIFILLIITALLNVFMTQGQNLIFQYGIIKIYREGLNIAGFMILRLVFLIIGTSLLTLTTSPIELTDGLEKLMSPLKRIGISSHDLAMMMTIALRFIPTLIDETDKIMKAQMARGAEFESGNLLQRAKNFIPVLVPLFISSFRRADDLAMAMEARCYRGGEGRTRMKVLKFHPRDGIAVLVIIVLVSLSIWSRFYY